MKQWSYGQPGARIRAATILIAWIAAIVLTMIVVSMFDSTTLDARMIVGAAAWTALIATASVIVAVRHLARERDRLSTAIDNMTQGLLLFDGDQRVVVCNQRYLDMYGVSPKVVKPGATLVEVIAHRKTRGSIVGDVDVFCAQVLRDLPSGRPRVVEMADGRAIQIIDRPMASGGWVSTHEDITERRRLDERVAHLAHHDPLTDLPNRALFLDRLQTECDRPRGGLTFAVLFIDLDGFKAVNDTFGHSAGDELLVTVARRLRSCVGERDLVARLGGDEFAVLQCGISFSAEARDLAASILDAFGEPNGRPGDSLGIEASIGIAVASDAFEDAGRMLRSADDAMYRAKASGRGSFQFYDAAIPIRGIEVGKRH
ncbi:diguanylate cyclase domain-containing protein [Tardiphaga sp. 862_B3_N1_1]|uniref:diguanylate cyclase domain-containing protein n=1 Tax=Tardiphaga sp. 862_B3_N1_1 TaxID=3240763 RepID=UPI003F8B05EE